MKKAYTNLLSVMAIVAMVFMIGCEGPDGPAGADGVDGTAECLTCHNEGTAFTEKQVQFAESAHSLGTYYTRDGECSGCHSTEGFLARKDFTSISEIYDLAEDIQTPISCRACHNVHYEYDETDWALSFMDIVDETLFGSKSPEYDSFSFGDFGNSNQCMQCHQSRDKENVPSLTSTADVNVYQYWGPHYGVQGNVLHAQAGIHIAGTETYPTYPNGHTSMLSNACIDCHMHEGSHTLAVNYAACVGCHTDEDTAEGLVEDLEEEIHTSLFALGAILAEKGAMVESLEDGVLVGYVPAGGYGGIDIPVADARAVFNYMVVYEDHSYGTHNPSYIKALLKNTIADVQ